MTFIKSKAYKLFGVVFIFCLQGIQSSIAKPNQELLNLVKTEKAILLDSLKDFVSIETFSRDFEGLEKFREIISKKLELLNAKIEVITYTPITNPVNGAIEKAAPTLKATIKGTGKGRILLLAHMDTVYQKGTLSKQPFRIDGNKAYGVGIIDDKQGVAVVLHVLSLLKQLNFKDYEYITVLFNGDEEISSPGSRTIITELATTHDAILSFEGSPVQSDRLALATAGIAYVTLTVQGKASHPGNSPEKGRNALYELAHQILQTKGFSDPSKGLKLNWTVAAAGTSNNVIPANASATADIRALNTEDFPQIETKIREAIKNKLIPDTNVNIIFDIRRPPLQATDASRALGKYAQNIYKELGKELFINEIAEGGGTDAAFAGLKTKAPVIERCGLLGYGAHTNDDEYILIDSIEPRLYLITQLIMDIAKGKAPILKTR